MNSCKFIHKNTQFVFIALIDNGQKDYYKTERETVKYIDHQIDLKD